MAYKMLRFARASLASTFVLWIFLGILSFTPKASATMTFTVTKTTITVTTTPGGIGGSVSGHTWAGSVGPIRYRDRQYITSGDLHGWGGATCKDPIVIRPCPSKGWDVMEEHWIIYQGGSTKTYTRTDTDWQPNDIVCEGTAQKAAYDTAWLPSAGEITPVGICANLPDPNPTPPPTCSITTPTVTLKHGNLAASAVQGAIAAATATLICTGTMAVKVQAVLNSALPISTIPVRGDGIDSHLTVNGVDGATGVTISATANQPVTLSLVSKLSSTSATPAAGALKGSAFLLTAGQQKLIDITGTIVTSPATAPKPVLSMALVDSDTTNLGVSWGWSTSSQDYGAVTVQPNYMVGLFIRSGALGKWYKLEADSSATAVEPAATRVQRFHDAFPIGEIDRRPSHRFEKGVWCVFLGAATTAETGGDFVQLGNEKSCVTVP